MTDPDRLSAARRALEAGVAHNAQGRPGRASGRFRAALRHLDAAGSVGVEPAASLGVAGAYLRARALLGLVMSDFELRADLVASRETLDEAGRWAEVAGAGAVQVAVHGQRGLLALRAGDVPAALRELDSAVARIGDAEPLDACVLLLNRGTVNLEAGHLSRARQDLRACAERAAALGDELVAFKARHNLGYLEYLAGDLPAALAAMGDAGAPHGASPAVALLDRAQVLLEAGLTGDAEASLARAEALFAQGRLAFDLAQTALARAHCALLAGRPRDALLRARSARSRFARRGSHAWARRADLAARRAQLGVLLAAGAPRAAYVRVAEHTRALADAAAGTRSGREVRRAALVTAAEAWVAAGRTQEAQECLAAAGRFTGREPLALTLQARVVRARLEAVAGHPAGVRRQLRLGLAALAEHRRRLGSVEAVVAAAVHADRLVGVGVDQALRDGDARGVLAAVERGRATFAGPARVRPPDDPVLAELLAELRHASERRRLLDPDDRSAAASAERELLRREVDRLRDEARERSWRVGAGERAPEPVGPEELDAAIRGADPDGMTVVDYLVHDGVVHAVVTDVGGARLHRLGPADAVAELVRRLWAGLGALANPMMPPPLREAVTASVRRTLDLLDERLLSPVRSDGAMHVVAPGALVTVPWGLLPSRTGLPTTVGSRLQTAAPAPLGHRVASLAGPGLTHAAAEAAAVAAAWPGAQALVGEDATCAATSSALGTHDVVHLAAHGRHEAENPLFSWVRLADGPLFAHELEGTVLPGSVVVLSACEVGQASVRPGGEVLGLASVLLRLGAGAVVASLAPLRDELAATVMPALHRHLRDGLSPAAALTEACSEAQEPVPLTCFAPLTVRQGRPAPRRVR